MKTTFFRNVALVSLLAVFTVGCGKDGGGGSSNNYGNMNPITDGTSNENIDAQAVQGYNYLVQWRNSLQNNPQLERQLLGQRGYSKGVVASSNNSTPQVPAGCKEIKAFGYVVGYYCTGSGQVTQPAITPLQVIEKRCTREIYVNNTNQRELRYATASSVSANSCTASGAEAVYSVGNNTELNQLLSFQLGKIYRIQQTQVSGAFYVEVGPKGTFGNATRVYVIDTTMHSIYNPVMSQDFNDTSKLTRIYEAY